MSGHAAPEVEGTAWIDSPQDKALWLESRAMAMKIDRSDSVAHMSMLSMSLCVTDSFY